MRTYGKIFFCKDRRMTGGETYVCIMFSGIRLNGIQDLFFLGLMSRMDGEAAAGELTKLETFTERYQSDILTEEDVANFAVELSIGSIRCVELRSGEDALEKLAGKYPEARNMREEPEEAAGGNGR